MNKETSECEKNIKCKVTMPPKIKLLDGKKNMPTFCDFTIILSSRGASTISKSAPL
jgi:hypothetical protein